MTDNVVSSAVRVASAAGADEPGRGEPLVTARVPHLPFVVHEADLYYADNAALRVERRPLAGGDAVTVAEVPAFVQELQVIAGAVHWLISDYAAPNPNSLYRASRDGGWGERVPMGAATQLLSGDELGYYGVGDIDPEAATALRVHRWLAPNYENELLAARVNAPGGVAMDESHLYFTDRTRASEPQKLRLLRVPR